MSTLPYGSRPDARIARLYELALRLYPSRFRAEYGAPMQQALRDALADRSIPRRAMLAIVTRDFVASLIKEHIAMLRSTYGRPALLFNAVILSGIATGVALALYAIPQQVLRTGADDPQIQMATDLAARLNQVGVDDGLRQGVLVNNGGMVDMGRSLSPFLIVYDDQGRALGSNAQLNGVTPVPPSGVFDYVRTHGEERVSWQPVRGSHGVRIAAVVERVNGPQPGFVLAGRSMREVEARIEHVKNLAELTWIGMLGLILLGTLVYGQLTRPQGTPAASVG